MNSPSYIQTLHLALLCKSGSFVRVCDLLRTKQTFLQLVTQKNRPPERMDNQKLLYHGSWSQRGVSRNSDRSTD